METIKKTYAGCYGIVVKDNKVLLIRKKNGAYKGKLDLPGGGIKYNESPEDTLIREFKEETNLDIKDFTLYKVITNYAKWNYDNKFIEDLSHIAIIYKVDLPDNLIDKIKTAPDGHDSLGSSWYDIDNLSTSELSPLAKVIKE